MQLLSLLVARVDLLAQLARIERVLYLHALRFLRVEQLGSLYVRLEGLVDFALLFDGLLGVLLDEDVQGLHEAGQVVGQSSLYSQIST